MKKYVVLSVNENPKYLFYLPLTAWAWRYFGWEVMLFMDGLNDQPPIFELAHSYSPPLIKFGSKLLVDGYKSETVTQISRLYGACVLPTDSYIMTGDLDMIPLSDYWKPDESKITVWGHDLTSYQHVPICYIGMPAQRWIEVMGITSNDYNAMIKRDLDRMPNAKSQVFHEWWSVDQQLITDRINACQFEKDFVYRGTYPNGYAKGRVDRSAWHLNHEQFIDAHLMRDIYINEVNFNKTMELLHKVWPDEEFTWFKEYTNEFKKLL
jgi:hypothetical protein